MSYPKSEHTERPYRLWDANQKVQIRWRYYSDLRRAHWGALKEVRWAKTIGTTIEVYNAHTGKFLGSYTLRVNSVTFVKG